MMEALNRSPSESGKAHDVWRIEMPLTDSDRWFVVCECDTPQSAAAVVMSLCASGVNMPQLFRVVHSVTYR